MLIPSKRKKRNHEYYKKLQKCKKPKLNKNELFAMACFCTFTVYVLDPDPDLYLSIRIRNRLLLHKSGSASLPKSRPIKSTEGLLTACWALLPAAQKLGHITPTEGLLMLGCIASCPKTRPNNLTEGLLMLGHIASCLKNRLNKPTEGLLILPAAQKLGQIT